MIRRVQNHGSDRHVRSVKRFPKGRQLSSMLIGFAKPNTNPDYVSMY